MQMIIGFLASLGPIGVGLVFLITAALKLVAPYRFHRHLWRLGVFDGTRWTAPVPATLATGEAVFGAALIAGLAPPLVAPATVGLLAALGGVTIWSTSTK